MKRLLLGVLVLLLSISLFGCTNEKPGIGHKSKEKIQNDESDMVIVTRLVEDFGKKLQTVSLQASSDVIKKSMQENYGDFVSPELLAAWQNEPLKALGRLTSSPWPDRIEILTIEKAADADAYEVKGEIIEITSTEKTGGGVAAKEPIILRVNKIKDRWLIDAVTRGAYEDNDSTAYRNTRYSFTFLLPESWKGYSIVTDQWEGLAVRGSQGNEEAVETGVLISIRHPQWTSENSRQDIPIMVFTLAQWNALQREEFHIGAAPIGPKELGRNSKYVFALPARYNFAFPTGYEEVENILENNPLQAKEEMGVDD
jgi:hypothetical protein